MAKQLTILLTFLITVFSRSHFLSTKIPSKNQAKIYPVHKSIHIAVSSFYSESKPHKKIYTFLKRHPKNNDSIVIAVITNISLKEKFFFSKQQYCISYQHISSLILSIQSLRGPPSIS